MAGPDPSVTQMVIWKPRAPLFRESRQDNSYQELSRIATDSPGPPRKIPDSPESWRTTKKYPGPPRILQNPGHYTSELERPGVIAELASSNRVTSELPV